MDFARDKIIRNINVEKLTEEMEMNSIVKQGDRLLVTQFHVALELQIERNISSKIMLLCSFLQVFTIMQHSKSCNDHFNMYLYILLLDKNFKTQKIHL